LDIVSKFGPLAENFSPSQVSLAGYRPGDVCIGSVGEAWLNAVMVSLLANC